MLQPIGNFDSLLSNPVVNLNPLHQTVALCARGIQSSRKPAVYTQRSKANSCLLSTQLRQSSLRCSDGFKTTPLRWSGEFQRIADDTGNLGYVPCIVSPESTNLKGPTGNNQSIKDFLELETEVLTLVLMLGVDGEAISNLPPCLIFTDTMIVQSDSSSIVHEYRCICQQMHLLDDGYHRWVAESCEYFSLWLPAWYLLFTNSFTSLQNYKQVGNPRQNAISTAYSRTAQSRSLRGRPLLCHCPANFDTRDLPAAGYRAPVWRRQHVHSRMRSSTCKNSRTTFKIHGGCG